MSDLLHPDIRSRRDELAQSFASAQPFRHVVVDEFLRRDALDALLQEFPSFDPNKAVNEMGEVGRKAVVSDLARIGPAYRALDALLQDNSFLHFMERIAGITDLLYDPEYVGGGTHENLDGQDLDVHVDFNYHPSRRLHRRLNLILFLNPEWHDSWGGCLELHRDPWRPEDDLVSRVVPIANRAVLFETTETSWHGFSRITLPDNRKHVSRKSVAVYYYTATRPVAQTAAPHGTVYVPRPLPEHFQAGYTLREDDVYHLQVLWERRNAQLRFLYQRELEYAETLENVIRSPSFRIGHLLTWPARVLRGRKST